MLKYYYIKAPEVNLLACGLKLFNNGQQQLEIRITMNDILHTYRKMLSKKTGAGTSDRLRIAKGSIKKKSLQVSQYLHNLWG